ncbi:hypothetical protein VN12_20665 [Pirellula sp. SH-Sr6A]|nr:hypothetical protein VN12_20665 [Pirellula sp. SH-Sr6A]
MSKTPRQRAFEREDSGWQPALGTVVFVRSRQRHLSRVCGRGTVTNQSLLIRDCVEVTIKSGTRVRTEIWCVDDLRPAMSPGEKISGGNE